MHIGSRRRSRFLTYACALAATVLISTIVAPLVGAAEYQYKTLHVFCPRERKHTEIKCLNGAVPNGGLIMDRTGDLYGTTRSGGTRDAGVVFQLTPNATRTAWTEAVLHRFCAQRHCADGSTPNCGLIMDGEGNLYGTTGYFPYDPGLFGVAFELSPSETQLAWTETVLHHFCPRPHRPCQNEGMVPDGSLVMDGAGNLYGTPLFGGIGGIGELEYGAGVAFELTPNSTRTGWRATILYDFCVQAACADGALPNGALIMDGAGNLYGTAAYGGANGTGVAFELVKSP